MIINRKKVGNKQVRIYKSKVSKKELQDVINDILESYKTNQNVSIEVTE